ncbi:MAG: hypothetical protein ACOC44_08105 [Promethearchaeia archaeon]
MKTFQINQYLTLRLEHGQTNIYIDDKKVLHCKFLLLNIPVDEIPKYNEINSIDHAAELLNKDLEVQEEKKGDSVEISPEVEFWAHCSNIQAWAENDYDTRLLHSNLSFPLLKKLTEAGDPIAKGVFKKEITTRFKSGYLPVMVYLVREGYLDYFNWDESEELYASLSYEKLKTLRKKVREYHQTHDEGFILENHSQ